MRVHGFSLALTGMLAALLSCGPEPEEEEEGGEDLERAGAVYRFPYHAVCSAPPDDTATCIRSAQNLNFNFKIANNHGWRFYGDAFKLDGNLIYKYRNGSLIDKQSTLLEAGEASTTRQLGSAYPSMLRIYVPGWRAWMLFETKEYMYSDKTFETCFNGDCYQCQTNFTNCASTGTTRPIYRYYNPTIRDHLLTTSKGTVSGYNYQKVVFRVFTYADGGLRPIYRCYAPSTKDHFVSNYSSCEGQVNEGRYGWVSASKNPFARRELVRCYHPQNRNHLTTVNRSECNEATGWKVEGPQGYVP